MTVNGALVWSPDSSNVDDRRGRHNDRRRSRHADEQAATTLSASSTPRRFASTASARSRNVDNGTYFYTYLQNGAELEVGSGGTLDLQDDQQILENGGTGNLLHVLSGGTLTPTSAAGTPSP